jgi:basic amino acid/polyamine antiporter, APA family
MSTESKKPLFTRDATGLVKSVSGLDALGTVLSGMGLLLVFDSFGLTLGFYPNGNPITAPLMGLLLVLPLAVMYILFTISLPRSGGDYVWTGRIFHPIVGFFTNFSITILAISFLGAIGTSVSQWCLSEMFYDLGLVYKSSSLISYATTIQTTSNAFWISVLFILIAAGLVAAKTSLAAKTMRYWTFASWIIGAIFIATVLYAGSKGFESNFNAISGANYTQVISAGQSVGAHVGVAPALSSASLYAGALGLLGYLSFNYSSYFAAEIKHGNRAQVLAQLGGSVIFAIFSVAMLAAMYYGMGPNFANSISTLYTAHLFGAPVNYPYVGLPMASGLAVFWTQNPILIVLFNMSFVVALLMLAVAILFTLSRNLFAWSFDRVIPVSFADVNRRTGTPLKAIGVMTVIGLFFAYVSNYQIGLFGELFSYGTAGTFIAFLFVALAAIVFPWRRKDIFALAHSNAKKKILGIPAISLAGIFSIISCSIVIYALILPDFGPSFTKIFFEGIVPTFIAGAVIYTISAAIRSKQGISLSLIGKEIPPE